jgi:hypothetical protein
MLDGKILSIMNIEEDPKMNFFLRKGYITIEGPASP